MSHPPVSRSLIAPSRLPIVAAPMAGGPTTVALAMAVGDAGGFPILAGGYTSAQALGDQIRELRARGMAFGVNLFVPSKAPVDAAAFAAYAAELAPEAGAYGLTLSTTPVSDDDAWADKLALLLADPVPVVSLTFGLPTGGEIASLRRAGSRVLATVTTAGEAELAQRAGVDGLFVQGPRAGGHSATFDAGSALPSERPTTDVVREVRRAARLPVVAAGGVDGPAAVQTLLAAGAEAVAVGTLLLRTDEAGTSATHREALTDPRFTDTVMTRAFTGRPARALGNGFVDRHREMQLSAYPAVHHLTRPLRQAAARAGDSDRLHLWAGTGFRSAPTGPAARVVEWLAPGD